MKKIIVLAVSLLSFATVTIAQEVPAHVKEHRKREKITPEVRAQKHVDMLHADVNLTDVQKPKVYDLALEQAKKIDEIRAKYKGQPENREAAKKETIAIRKDYRQKIHAVLTPEQLKVLKAKHKENKDGDSEHD